MNVPGVSVVYSSPIIPWRRIMPSMLGLLLLLPASAHATYWNLFNIEGESTQSSVYITYDTLADMLSDDNRTGSFIPDNTGSAAENVVGSGSDGSTYWNLFNIEGESTQSAVYITYTSLLDMLNDDNRIGSFIPDNTGLSAENVVGSGAWVSITGPGNGVPEPATIILFAMGLLCLGYAKMHVRREEVVLRRSR